MDTRETAQVNELVQAAKAGDDEALRQLIAWAMEYLFPAVLSMLRERHGQGTYVTDAFHQSGPDLFERMQDDAWAITNASCCRMADEAAFVSGRSALGSGCNLARGLRHRSQRNADAAARSLA